MDLVLIGLPGSGKTAVGRRMAARHDARFIDLDATIEATTGQTIRHLFDEFGEAGFRSLERAAVADLGRADSAPGLRRVIATGGGTIMDPVNRWSLYRNRRVAWLDAPPEVLAQRLRNSPHPRPLLQGRDPVGAIRDLATKRERFYAPGLRLNGLSQVGAVLERLDTFLAEPEAPGTTLLAAATRLGQVRIGAGIALAALLETPAVRDAGRAIIVSEPVAWSAVGQHLAEGLTAAGIQVERILLPTGEPAKRLAVIEAAGGDLARLRAERSEPLIAIGGGALGDAAGFLAATWLRGVPLVHVPTTLVAQVDSSIGGKAAVDLAEGKNLVGAFHQPIAIVIDVELLAGLPERQRRAALGEAAKMAAIGDEALFELLERDGPAIARGDPAAIAHGALAELVERCAWAKIEVVLADERENGAAGSAAAGSTAPGRLALNLGHSLGHGFEAAAGYGDALVHGEAVAYGLRAACRIGVELGLTPVARAERIERLLTSLELAPAGGLDRLGLELSAVLAALATDKKHASGRLRWVLPTTASVEIRSDVPDEVVARIAAQLRAPTDAAGPAGQVAQIGVTDR
ncbi:MAG: bifunctional shikimate kinase/3-dehydroquinate synthase [Candidatus Limnocylindrales bacterium]